MNSLRRIFSKATRPGAGGRGRREKRVLERPQEGRRGKIWNYNRVGGEEEAVYGSGGDSSVSARVVQAIDCGPPGGSGSSGVSVCGDGGALVVSEDFPSHPNEYPNTPLAPSLWQGLMSLWQGMPSLTASLKCFGRFQSRQLCLVRQGSL
jgi:hypothetical protein